MKHFTTIKYGLVQGQFELREKLCNKVLSSHFTPENVVITNGGSEALNLILASFPEKSKILMPKPYYYSYPYLASYNRLEPVYSPMKDDHIDMQDIENKISEVNAIMVNSPTNPTGMVEKPDTIKKLERLANETGRLLIFDEVYRELIYEGTHYSPKGDNVINVDSFSKTFNLCGARIGYCYSKNEELIEKIIQKKTHTSMNTSTTGQSMAIAALDAPNSFKEKNRKIFKERREIIYKGLKEIGFELHKPEGAFYALPRATNPQKVVEDLFDRYKVIAYNGEWFGAGNRIRLSYALKKEKIEEGLGRIEKYIKQENPSTIGEFNYA